jgi:hypothetical protein
MRTIEALAHSSQWATGQEWRPHLDAMGSSGSSSSSSSSGMAVACRLVVHRPRQRERQWAQCEGRRSGRRASETLSIALDGGEGEGGGRLRCPLGDEPREDASELVGFLCESCLPVPVTQVPHLAHWTRLVGLLAVLLAHRVLAASSVARAEFSLSPRLHRRGGLGYGRDRPHDAHRLIHGTAVRRCAAYPAPRARRLCHVLSPTPRHLSKMLIRVIVVYLKPATHYRPLLPTTVPGA